MIKNYFWSVWQIITSPSQFFRQLPTEGGFSGPLAFALVTHWMGSALGYLIQLFTGTAAVSLLEKMMQLSDDYPEIDTLGKSASFQEMKDRVLEWGFGAGSVIIDPFLTLVSILVTAAFVFMGARILISPSKLENPKGITYESVVRIISYGMAPQILSILPFFGYGVASLYTLVVTIIGMREVYRIGTARAAVIVLFPKILVLGVVFTGFFIFLFLILGLVASFFSFH